jgi:hypothetical protein
VEHVDAARELVRQGVGQRSRPVRGSVVHDEHTVVRRRENLPDQRPEVLPFVVGRHDDERALTGLAPAVTARAFHQGPA